MGYLGKQPALQASEYREEFNITSTTTNIITSGYVRTGSSNYLEVYRNGVLLGKADYTLQSDYKTIVLTNAAVAGDIVVVLGRRNLTQGLKVAERRHEHVIQNGETTVTFPFPLTADITDVYINGVKLWYGDGSGDGSNSDYAINPVTRVISFGLNPSVGDTVSIVSREPTSVSSTPLPLIDSNGASVISENGGVISLSADTANVGSNALVVDASGNVGIGVTTIDSMLHLQKNDVTAYDETATDGQVGVGPTIYLENPANNNGTVGGQIVFGMRSTEVQARIGATGGTYAALTFGTADAERMRIDSSGNVLVGKTASAIGTAGFEALASGNTLATRDNGVVMSLNRQTSDGTILDLRKDGITVGSIAARSGDLLIGTGAVGLRFDDNVDAYIPFDVTTSLGRHNAIDLGYSTVRFNDIYLGNTPNVSSDRNEKQDIEKLTEAEQRVAVVCKGLLRKFRWIDAVAKKGDEARIHFGIIAQDLQAAFEAEGLDAGRYGMFMSNTWWETSETYIDDEGVEQTRTNTYDTAEEAPEGAVERTRLGVRYSELLAFIIAAI